jgi:hypothetical protein
LEEFDKLREAGMAAIKKRFDDLAGEIENEGVPEIVARQFIEPEDAILFAMMQSLCDRLGSGEALMDLVECVTDEWFDEEP